ncbi:MAG: glycosyltransferase family 39 protein [Candidatus Doudnabacteria bacterium]|nr:glycosyltransferase family 39 protein [Candidatus Doudnabacteria bacterium]
MRLAVILILGALLRLYHNTAVALWHDEAFSALYTRDYGWGEMMYRIGLDVHPPLYYILLKFWTLIFGHSLISLRGLSILLGVLTIWIGYVLVKKISGSEKFALYAGLLLALNPFQIQYSLEARMYTLGTFLVLASSYLLLKALETNQRKYWIWYAVAAAASLYTHYFLFFSVAAQILYLIYVLAKSEKFSLSLIKSQKFINAAIAGAVMLILYLPWIPTFIVQNQRVAASYWIPPMDRWSIPSTIWKMAVGGQGTNRFMLSVATLIAAYLIYYYFKKTKEDSRVLVLLSLLVPFIGSILISLKTAIFLERYFVFAALFLIIILAVLIMQIQTYVVRRTLAALLVVFSLVAFFKNWQDLDVAKKPGMTKAAELVNEQSTKSDQIYVGSSFVYFTFKYYNQTGIAPKLYSAGSLETIPHFSGTALLTNDDLILDFNQAKKNQTIWLVWTTGFGSSKPNVPGNWSRISESEYEDAPGFKGNIVVTRYRVN